MMWEELTDGKDWAESKRRRKEDGVTTETGSSKVRKNKKECKTQRVKEKRKEKQRKQEKRDRHCTSAVFTAPGGSGLTVSPFQIRELFYSLNSAKGSVFQPFMPLKKLRTSHFIFKALTN